MYPPTAAALFGPFSSQYDNEASELTNLENREDPGPTVFETVRKCGKIRLVHLSEVDDYMINHYLPPLALL